MALLHLKLAFDFEPGFLAANQAETTGRQSGEKKLANKDERNVIAFLNGVTYLWLMVSFRLSVGNFL